MHYLRLAKKTGWEHSLAEECFEQFAHDKGKAEYKSKALFSDKDR
jgi:hypothetical protein